MVDNPKRIVASGLNVAIERAQGELIMRIDGHGEVATDFVSQVVRLMDEHPEAWSGGGPIVHAGTNRFGEAVAVAMSHPLGVGLATHRFPNYEGYVEGAHFPTFRKWIFDRIGKFDEQLVRTEDDEFNYRIAQAGGKIYVSPRVRYVYYVRDALGKLFRQYFQYSFWRIPVVRKHKKPTTLRQIVPPLFFLAMFVLAVVGAWLRQPLVALALPAIYLAGADRRRHLGRSAQGTGRGLSGAGGVGYDPFRLRVGHRVWPVCPVVSPACLGPKRQHVRAQPITRKQ